MFQLLQQMRAPHKGNMMVGYNFKFDIILKLDLLKVCQSVYSRYGLFFCDFQKNYNILLYVT